MNKREVVRAAIEFKKPVEVPYRMWVDAVRFKVKSPEIRRQLIEILQNESETYIVIVFCDAEDTIGWSSLSLNFPDTEEGWRQAAEQLATEVEDEWGVIWKEFYVVRHPLEDAFDLQKVKLPNPRAAGRFDKARTVIQENGDDYYILGMVFFTLFERLWSLRGFHNALTDPYLHQDQFIELRKRIMEYDLGMIEEWLKLGVDGIFIGDDWGTQQGLMIHPRDWRVYYKPCYQEIFRAIHEGGAHVWMHSCGNIREIIRDLVDLGLDVLNPVQPHAMDLNELGREFGGKICFYGGIDSQRTLPCGSPSDVALEIEHLVDTLGRSDGGYIGCSSTSLLPDVPLDNVRTVFRIFRRMNRVRGA